MHIASARNTLACGSLVQNAGRGRTNLNETNQRHQVVRFVMK
jgi:hypothetical protein